LESKNIDNVTWERTFHENGNLERETPYVNGLKHGVERKFYENENLMEETSYRKGELHGLRKLFHENGGRWVEQSYLEGKPSGLFVQIDETGNLREGIPYINGEINGLVCKWDKDGRLIKQIPYINGKRNGVAISRSYPDGEESKAYFLNDKLHREDGPADDAIHDKGWYINGVNIDFQINDDDFLLILEWISVSPRERTKIVINLLTQAQKYWKNGVLE
jgi:hypothetical protein